MTSHLDNAHYFAGWDDGFHTGALLAILFVLVACAIALTGRRRR